MSGKSLHTLDMSRRNMLRGAALVAGVSALVGAAAAAGPAAADSKFSKAMAKYQASPKGGARCGACSQFQPPSDTCRVVAGQVSPEGWCLLYAPK